MIRLSSKGLPVFSTRIYLTIVFLFVAMISRFCVGADPVLTQAEQQQLDQLVQGLSSPDPIVLHRSLVGIKRMGTKASGEISRLEAMFDDDRTFTIPSSNIFGRQTYQVNVQAVATLAASGMAAKPVLERTLATHKDSKVRLATIEPLKNLQPPVSIELWLAAFQDEDRQVRREVAFHLKHLNDPACAALFRKALWDESADVQVIAAVALGKSGDVSAVDPLIEALPVDPTDNRLTNAIVNALWNLGAPAVKHLLDKQAMLDEVDLKMAASMIGRLDAMQDRSLLLEGLRSSHRGIRWSAANRLAKLKLPEVVALIVAGVQDPDPQVRVSATRLLGDITDDTSADVYREILLRLVDEDPEEPVRSQALWTLYFAPGLPTDTYWETLSVALDDSSARVRCVAVLSCIKFKNPRFVPKLKELLGDTNVSVRAEAATALGYYRVVEVVPDLIDMADSEDGCAKSATEALGVLGTDEAIIALAEQMHKANIESSVRRDIIYALSLSTNPKAKEVLKAALADPALVKERLSIESALKRIASKP
ncbi:HEAT repeat domain-containing protein [Blastopirellula marina]|uniref:HEAT repeat domain-containing protein n=1 Tax=Blastopirellula marina TaxID=124 RepID=A0A2S8GJ34_9BACT|nr:HEAT repeat domain-containing protein [Blastopirellula marina]PQO44438.1 hypothetical protein C5Y93_18660 [Blastopirellula marina]